MFKLIGMFFMFCLLYFPFLDSFVVTFHSWNKFIVTVDWFCLLYVNISCFCYFIDDSLLPLFVIMFSAGYIMLMRLSLVVRCAAPKVVS